MDEGSTPKPRSVALVVLLVTAMVTATYQQGALAVLSGFLIEEFGITRSQLGLVFTASSLIGAAASPILGVMADRNARRMMAGLFVLGGLGTLLAAAAPYYGVLLAAAVIGGFAGGSANPATNRIVSERIPLAQRGIVIGLKQAGPPLSVFMAGLTLPTIALLAGWRTALATGALLSIAGFAATRVLVPPTTQTSGLVAKTPKLPRDVRASMRWLNAIGFGIATGNGAMLAFLPLYAQEQVGMSPTTAGLVASVLGLSGVIGRISWGGLSGRFKRPSTALIIISTVAIMAALAVGFSASQGPGWLWLGAVGAGLSTQAWHAVAWLVIIARVDTSGIGRVSGVMQGWSVLGFAVGPFAAGSLIDATGSYWPAWGSLAALYAVVTLMTILFRQGATRRRLAAAGEA